MKWMHKAILGSLISLAFSPAAQAVSTSNGVLLNANVFMYDDVDKVDSGPESKSTLTIYDLKLGYLTSTGMYLGVIHTRRSVSGTTSYDGNATGASVGYIGSSGFFLKGHYLLTGEYAEMKEGTGYQLDFGYLTSVTSNFMVGVELTHRNMTYTDVPGAADKYNKVETFPMLTVGFVF